MTTGAAFKGHVGAARGGLGRARPLTAKDDALHDDFPIFGRYRSTGLAARLLAATRRSSDRWLGRRRAFFLRAIGVRMLQDRPVDVETFGAKMRLRPAHSSAEKKLAFTPQFFDAPERSFLLAHLGDAFAFVDLGADVGGYALFMAAHAGPRARILAVEPQPDIFERLVFNIGVNAFSTVKALACAVADRDGPVTLFVNPANSSETSMRIVNAHAQGRQIEVEGRSLAGLLVEEGMGRIDAMKVDLEGAEDIVLEPFFHDSAEASWPGILIVKDASTRWTVDLPGLLAGKGYALALRTGTNLVYRRGR